MPTLVLPETTIHYLRDGAGAPALVFVHGGFCDHSDWRFQLAHFSPRHEVVAPDLHGHGRSTPTPGRISVDFFARDVVALCTALRLTKVVLVGHSMGCRVLLRIWRTAPDLVAGMVFVDGSYLVPELLGERSTAQRAELAQAARERVSAAYAHEEPSELARRAFTQMFYDSRFDVPRDALVRRAMALPAFVARELMPDFAAWDVLNLEPVLGSVEAPMLVIASTWMNDRMERVSLQPGVTTPWLAAVAAWAPQAHVVRQHGSGHFPMLERPQDVNREIESFLRRHALG